ncbi:MAG: N-acetylmuramoyl-L-alanine amidase [Olsenella sp.]|nr:N-acetylmuramoyl-L-alanine amidase [Olsenella sp.]
MRDWARCEADVVRLMNKHFTPGRSGARIQHVVVHYNDADGSVEDVWGWWQTRKASAHYQVESSGRVGQLVWDRDTAWHAGLWSENLRSIGIEHANRSDGTISEACLDNGAHLVAALCRLYGLGRPQWNANVFPHCHFASTSCPGQIYGSQRDAYISCAQLWYDRMGAGGAASASPAPTVSSLDIDALAREVIAGKYGNGDDRRRALGANYDRVQARVNEILGIGSKPRVQAVDVDALARAVIRGDYGNGEERKRRLGANYTAVQRRVNELLS